MNSIHNGIEEKDQYCIHYINKKISSMDKENYWNYHTEMDAKKILELCKMMSLPITKPTFIFDGIESSFINLPMKKLSVIIDNSLSEKKNYISDIMITKSGSIHIEVKNDMLNDELANFTLIDGKRISVKLPHQSFAKKFLIRGIPINFTAKEIYTEIEGNDIKPVQVVRFRNMDNRIITPIMTILVTAIVNTIPEQITLFCRSFCVEPFKDLPKICRNCGRIGHSTQICQSKYRCKKCGDHHNEDRCTLNEIYCINCNGAHIYTSTDCPRLKLEQQIMDYKQMNGCSYSNAKQKIMARTNSLINEKTDSKHCRNLIDIHAQSESTKFQEIETSPKSIVNEIIKHESEIETEINNHQRFSDNMEEFIQRKQPLKKPFVIQIIKPKLKNSNNLNIHERITDDTDKLVGKEKLKKPFVIQIKSKTKKN